jgi:hypothetical protein
MVGVRVDVEVLWCTGSMNRAVIRLEVLWRAWMMGRLLRLAEIARSTLTCYGWKSLLRVHDVVSSKNEVKDE